MILIERLAPSETSLIVESKEVNGKKSLWLQGIFMQADIRNGNRRIYPLNELSRVTEEANLTIKANNGIFGELDHPETLNINLQKVSHVITELQVKGNDVIGKARIIEDTPMGSIAKALLESGVRFGVSSRASGSLDHDNVVSDMKFVTVDLVATPSAAGATPMAIYESLMNDPNGYKAITLSEQIREDNALQEHIMDEVRKFVIRNSRHLRT